MKLLLCLVALLPIVFSTKLEERYLLSSPVTADKAADMLGFYSLNAAVIEMVEVYGSDKVEHACESTACPDFLQSFIINDNNLPELKKSPFCQIACQKAQTYIHKGHL